MPYIIPSPSAWRLPGSSCSTPSGCAHERTSTDADPRTSSRTYARQAGHRHQQQQPHNKRPKPQNELPTSHLSHLSSSSHKSTSVWVFGKAWEHGYPPQGSAGLLCGCNHSASRTGVCIRKRTLLPHNRVRVLGRWWGSYKHACSEHREHHRCNRPEVLPFTRAGRGAGSRLGRREERCRSPATTRAHPGPRPTAQHGYRAPASSTQGPDRTHQQH